MTHREGVNTLASGRTEALGKALVALLAVHPLTGTCPLEGGWAPARPTVLPKVITVVGSPAGVCRVASEESEARPAAFGGRKPMRAVKLMKLIEKNAEKQACYVHSQSGSCGNH